jgi:hypothetical protein
MAYSAMLFFKSFLAGIAGLVAYLIVAVLALWYVPLLWTMWRSRSDGGGGYEVGVAIGRPSIFFLLGLASFLAAFWWEWRRAASGR